MFFFRFNNPPLPYVEESCSGRSFQLDIFFSFCLLYLSHWYYFNLPLSAIVTTCFICYLFFASFFWVTLSVLSLFHICPALVFSLRTISCFCFCSFSTNNSFLFTPLICECIVKYDGLRRQTRLGGLRFLNYRSLSLHFMVGSQSFIWTSSGRPSPTIRGMIREPTGTTAKTTALSWESWKFLLTEPTWTKQSGCHINLATLN